MDMRQITKVALPTEKKGSFDQMFLFAYFNKSPGAEYTWKQVAPHVSFAFSIKHALRENAE